MIKNIIFDFGDVFINLDKSALNRHLSKLKISELDDLTLRKHKDYEMGLISTEEFINYHLKTFPQLTKTNFVKAWNSILKNFPKERLEFLKGIEESGKYKLFLLSNTNDLHIKWVKDNVYFYEVFKSCFREFYLSFEINLRKPNEDIFQFVLQQNDLKPEETLFIDDTLKHINTAKSLDIKTWHLQVGNEDVKELLSKKEFEF